MLLRDRMGVIYKLYYNGKNTWHKRAMDTCT